MNCGVNNSETQFGALEISTFPKPFDSDQTPYRQLFFNEYFYQNYNKNREYEIVAAKIIVLGDLSVGKSSLINRACYKLYESSYKATIGLDIQLKRFKLFNYQFELQIWDTAGQEKFRSLAVSYYRGAKAIILVFDLQNINSLNNVEKWLCEALAVQDSNTPFLFLVGTKMDLIESHEALRNIENVAKERATKMNAEFWMVSSKTGQNVQNLFKRMAALIANNQISTHKNVGSRSVILGTPVITLETKASEISGKRNMCQSCMK